MKYLYKPQLLFFTVTLPQILIMMMLARVYTIISPELTAPMLHGWMIAGMFLSVACLGSAVYGIRGIIKKEPIDPKAAVGLLVLYLLFIYQIFMGYETIIPNSIPTWALMGMNPGWTILTLTMPVLCHTLLMVACWTIEKNDISKGLPDIGIAIAIPLGWYMVMFALSWLLAGAFQGLGQILPVLMVISVVCFFFFLIRGMLLILKNQRSVSQAMLGPLLFGCSLGGLALNLSMGNVFGNFNYLPFYGFAVVTGILISIPPLENRVYRLVLYSLRCLCFIYTLYFFLVFLPYLPLSIVLIVVFGSGVLMLTPLLLMFLHIRLLADDYRYLKEHYRHGVLIAILVVGCLIPPSAYAAAVFQDKGALDFALKYTFQRGYESKNSKYLDFSGIKRSLDNIKEMKESQRGGNEDIFNNTTPVLSAFYNSVVLNNFSLSDEKIKQIEGAILGEPIINGFEEPLKLSPENPGITTEKLYTETTYSEEEAVYKTWIHLELKNDDGWQNEYRTLFKLPEGSLITNYYLYVGEEKKYGMIADKRAANWVYQQTKSVNRDPGLLTELGSNIIEFKIFPFAAEELRKTGIEITHKTPVILSLDHQTLSLKLPESSNTIQPLTQPVRLSSGVVYMSKELKASLPVITRKPQLYFLLDYSKGNEKNIESYMNRVNAFVADHPSETAGSQILALNHQEYQTPYGPQWEIALKGYPVRGGLNLDYALKKIIYTHAVKETQTVPVIILVTDNPGKAFVSDDLKELAFAIPEGMRYSVLNADTQLDVYGIDGMEAAQPIELNTLEKVAVRVWNDNGKVYPLPDNGEDTIIATDLKTPITSKYLKGSQWEQGILLEVMHQQAQLFPENRLINQLEMVKGSINSKVMSPQTSFIVLENKVQENAMLEKQKQILGANRPLEIGDLQQMDEPPLMIMLGIAMFIVFAFKRHKRMVREGIF